MKHLHTHMHKHTHTLISMGTLHWRKDFYTSQEALDVPKLNFVWFVSCFSQWDQQDFPTRLKCSKLLSFWGYLVSIPNTRVHTHTHAHRDTFFYRVKGASHPKIKIMPSFSLYYVHWGVLCFIFCCLVNVYCIVLVLYAHLPFIYLSMNSGSSYLFLLY